MIQRYNVDIRVSFLYNSVITFFGKIWKLFCECFAYFDADHGGFFRDASLMQTSKIAMIAYAGNAGVRRSQTSGLMMKQVNQFMIDRFA